MNNKYYAIQLILLFLTISLFASDYTIPKFISGKIIPPANNTIIISAKPVTTAFVSDGKILLRRKFGAEGHGLFLGDLEKGAYKNLSLFRHPARTSLPDLVMYKFYASKSKAESRSTLDLRDIYFDNNFIYTVNRSTLVYNSGSGFKKLTALLERPSILKITSTPSGATVFIDGVECGVTPYNAGVLDVPSVVVRLNKDGFYIQEDFIDLQGGKSVVRKFKLVKAVRFDDGSLADADAYTAENTESVDELEGRVKKLNSDMKLVEQKNRNLLANFKRKYPLLSSRGEFEEFANFESRKRTFGIEKESKIEELNMEATLRIVKYEEALTKINKYKTNIENRVYVKYFPTSTLKLSRYNMKKHAFPVTATINEGAFDFSYAGYLEMATSEAKAFKGKITSGRLQLSYKNKQIKVKKGAKLVRRYYDFTGFVLRFKEKDYTFNGSYKFKRHLTSSKDWATIERKREREKKNKIEIIQKIEAELIQNPKLLIKDNMVKIHSGSFNMGSTSGDSDEKPVHRVSLRSFWLDKYEVTQAQFTNIMGTNPSNFKNCSTCPVEKVTWHEAKKYCNKLGKRLPTEAEWEYAARAGSRTKYYWGNSMDKAYGWYRKNSGSKTHSVGSKKPNNWGLYDMSGNVWEWCEDWDGDYHSNSQNNPKGISSGRYRVLRGGSWINGDNDLRSAYRYGNAPDGCNYDVGFRCAR